MIHTIFCSRLQFPEQDTVSIPGPNNIMYLLILK